MSPRKTPKPPASPYGIDIAILSDPDTVLPFCIMDATLITAMRTAAVAGMFAKYTAPKNAKVATLVGAGVIGRTAIMALGETVPTLETIYLCDLDISKAEGLKKEFEGVCKANIIPSTDTQGCAKKSELIVTQTTTSKPFITPDCVNKGATVIQMAAHEVEHDVIRGADQVFVDYWEQMIRHMELDVAQMHHAGEIQFEDVVELSKLALGEHPRQKICR